MCAECGPIPEEIKKAYEEFNEAIEKFSLALADDETPKGITVDWVLVMSENFIFENNDSTATSYMSRLNQPHYRTKGLIHEVLDNLQASDTAHRVMRHF